MTPPQRRIAGDVLAAALVLLVPATALAVSSADEICPPPNNDPCVITGNVVVDNGAVLDFPGTLRVEGPGTIDTGPGNVVIRCRDFVADTGDNVAIKARGSTGGVIQGGVVTLEALGSCSAVPETRCVTDAGCDFGDCTIHRCTGNSAITCNQNSQCNVGPCLGNRRCAGRTNIFCNDNQDCIFGVCDTDVTRCSGSLSRTCDTNADCDHGDCSVGTGNILLNGKIRAEGKPPGSIFINAKGDVTVDQRILLNSNAVEDDGGILEILAGGDVRINNVLEGVGGGESQGGDFSITAAGDIFLTGDVDLRGGDFDGGFLELDGTNVTITGDVNADSINGEGFGGEILAFADNNLFINDGVDMSTGGHEDADSFCGEAGAQEFEAGTLISVVETATLSAIGPRPDCAGGDFAFDSDGNVEIAGTINAFARGMDGDGGVVDVTADDDITVTGTARFDVTAGSGGAGTVEFFAGRDLSYSGRIDATASNEGSGDTITFDAGRDIFIDGRVEIGGDSAGLFNGSIDIDGCVVDIAAPALLDNIGAQGDNEITARRQLTIAAGATMRADAASGTNDIAYRNAGEVPIIDGTVTPAPNIELNEALSKCPVCGDGVIDTTETCDDGNVVGGDGCDTECQDEDCIDDTPGYPEVELCDDGVFCTEDSCPGGGCVHLPDHDVCDDGNDCTNDSCELGLGCSNVNHSGGCDDSVACTINDTCSAGVCAGVDNCPEGQFCNGFTGVCTPEATTTTTTLPDNVCGDGIELPPEECDDGDTNWQAGEYCNAVCVELACGDPNDSNTITPVDALFVLQVAVNLQECDACVCNVDNSMGANPVGPGDALRVLRRAVNLPVDLDCPPCP